MKVFFVVVLLSFLIGCEQNQVSSQCKEKADNGMVCTAQYDPVCGCNGKTYGNACEATRVGITDFIKGECKK